MGKVSISTKRVLWTTAGVAALVAVIFLGGALSQSDAPVPPATSESPRLESAKQYFDQATSALAAGDATTAVRLAERSLALDSSNTAASAFLLSAKSATSVVKANPNPNQTDSVADSPNPRDDSAYTQKSSDIQGFLPSELTGWSSGMAFSEGTEALVTFEPKESGSAWGTVTRAVFTVHERTSAPKARAFISSVHKAAYPDEASVVEVGVVPDAYFGQSQSGGSVIAFSRGRYIFELVLVTAPGIELADVKKVGIELASGWPASR